MWSPAPARRDHDEELRGLAARGGDGAQAALQAGHALLEGRHGRVGDAAVDVPELLQREQRGGVRARPRTRSWSSGRWARRGRPSSGPGGCRRARRACGSRTARRPVRRCCSRPATYRPVARGHASAYRKHCAVAATRSSAPIGSSPTYATPTLVGACRRASAASRSANRHASTPWTRRWSSRRSSIRARAGPSSPAAMRPDRVLHLLPRHPDRGQGLLRAVVECVDQLRPDALDLVGREGDVRVERDVDGADGTRPPERDVHHRQGHATDEHPVGLRGRQPVEPFGCGRRSRCGRRAPRSSAVVARSPRSASPRSTARAMRTASVTRWRGCSRTAPVGPRARSPPEPIPRTTRPGPASSARVAKADAVAAGWRR